MQRTYHFLTQKSNHKKSCSAHPLFFLEAGYGMGDFFWVGVGRLQKENVHFIGCEL